MNPMLEKLKQLKKMKPMPEGERDAKMSAVKEFGDMAKNAMGEKMHGLKKVTVASNSPEGLQKGLQKAEDIVQDPSMLHEDEQMEAKPCDEHSSLEEINMEMDRLAQLKAEKEAEESSESPDMEKSEHDFEQA